jgi:hypothetical protein
MAHKSSWSDLYIAATLETGELLPVRILAGRHGIAARLRELPRDQHAHKERQEINAALLGLQRLQNERIPH